jgi:hypothetical protein
MNMLTQSILDAIRTAPETVEWKRHTKDSWSRYIEFPNIDFKFALESHWRIKPKPYEMRLTLWLNGVPNHIENGATLGRRLFGDNVTWSPIKEEEHNKKYEFTIREVVE